jgi:toxin-antitoxin system PIN domain toxin
VTVYLLDVNLLLALSDPMHVHHEAAHGWFAEHGRQAWATCPITENGFVRIASHPRYPNRPGDVSVVLAILRQFCAAEGHHFWTEDISIRDVLQPGMNIAPAQVTDLFLLGLAAHKEGKLATLDQRIPASAVRNGPQTLETIPI